MLRRAQEQQRAIAHLTASVGKHLKHFKTMDKWSDSRFETELFKAIINFKLRLHRAEPWLLSQKGLSEVSYDFNLLHDFHFGSQKRDLTRWLNQYGQIFLSDSEREEYKALSENEKEHSKWLRLQAEPKIQPLWYLTVSLCRLLQSDDFSLSPEEAYWLGLVDEVPGTDLPNIREMAESLDKKQT